MLSALFLFRYGDTWAPWRRCGDFAGVEKEEEMMELRSNEGINRLSGYSDDNDGHTRSLEATTTTRRTWGPHGIRRPDIIFSLRSSPDADNLTLRFISGDQTANKRILRWMSSFKTIRIYCVLHNIAKCLSSLPFVCIEHVCLLINYVQSTHS